MRKRTRTPARSGRLVQLVRAGLIAGVVVAATIYPIAGITGLAVIASTKAIEQIPTKLRDADPAQTSYVYAADGRTLVTMFYEEHRKYVPLTEMSPFIQQAIVASEDVRFYQHNGVDPKGVARAFVANSQAGGVSQGGSTLTMQYVRLALQETAQSPLELQAATAQTPGRKIREIRIAMELEKEMSKSEILERYLNAAYFGHRAYGIYAAAEIFFSKHPRELSASEAALIAGLVKAPSEYDPATSDQTAATERRNYVIDRMADLGYLSPIAAQRSKAEPIELNLSTPANECVSVPQEHNDWGFFCDYLKSWWMSQKAFGDSPSERLGNLRTGGYRIVTSLDPGIQKAAQDQVTSRESIGSPFAHGLVAVEPGTGHVKAMAVNRVYSLDQTDNGAHSNPSLRDKIKGNYPNTVTPLLGGGDLPGYQAGSTFKMFTMLAALDAGMPLRSGFNAPHRIHSIYDGGQGSSSCGGRWCPSNASGAMAGFHYMWSGFGKSVNTYFVWLLQQVGAEKAVQMAERLGLRWRTDVDKRNASPEHADKWGAFTLGVSDVTPLEMANAYATIAADGSHCEDSPVLSVQNPDGSPVTYRTLTGVEVEVATPRCHAAFSPDVARAATDAARCPVGDRPATGGCGGWSTADGVAKAVGRPVAGKTGTTDSTRSAWFTGYTPELAVASFIADPDNPFNAVGDWQSQKPVDSAAGTLKNALKDRPVRQFAPPSAQIVG
ncbi:transglycosylase domain-containing protein [Solwaraspora sp. WMMD406]|uniref:transglycosylase domain-containing protein n=1 Tax=Solwaraspora sp. WMMD406 TaxID=3016095 RepID=UPI0024170EED|nr:transglycosylase domain-containing protein [Solwaraspora sp. WMMD406]MDG4764555.1 transglycosylase domain-containing protein [Solwaraspora sp. WMMD406]